MNLNPVFSLPVASDAVFDEHLRVKVAVDSGQVVAALAGVEDKAIGHLLQPVNAPVGRNVADIAKTSASAIQFATTTAAIAVGTEFEAGADGRIAPHSAGVAEGVVLEGAGAAGDVVRVIYYNFTEVTVEVAA